MKLRCYDIYQFTKYQVNIYTNKHVLTITHDAKLKKTRCKDFFYAVF